jgi:hypothetical protein
MKAAEIEAPLVTGDISITYRSELDVSSKDIFADLPPDVLQAIGKYDRDQLQQIVLKILLALRLGEDRVLHPGEHLKVFGEVVVEE